MADFVTQRGPGGKVARVVKRFWPILSVLVCLPALAGTGPNSANGRLLQRLVDAWPTMESPDRERAAHAFSVLGYYPATELMRRCAQAAQPESAACTVALAGLRDTDSAPILRKLARTANDAKVVGAAGLGLSAWEDRFSYYLLADALISGRGGPTAAAALAWAVDRMEHPWEQLFLRLAYQRSADADTRLTLAARLINHSPLKVRGPFADALFTAFEAAFAGPPATALETYRAQLAIFGLTRGIPAECEAALRTLDVAEWTDALLWAAVGPDCAALSSEFGVAVEPLRAPRFPTPPGLTLPTADARWLATIGHFEETEAQRLAAALTAAGEPRLAGRRYGVFAVPALISWTKVATPTRYRLLKLGHDATYPAAFDRFEPPLAQPDWWPGGLQLTIDDGPRPEALAAVLDVLSGYNVKATFFFVGKSLVREWLERPLLTRALLDRVIHEGHHIAFHGIDHFTEPHEHMSSWWPEQVADSVGLFRTILRVVAGRETAIPYGRLPGGKLSDSPRMRLAFQLAGLAAPVLWTESPHDWVKSTSRRDLEALAARHSAKPDAEPVIILLHEYVGLADQLDAFIGAIKRLETESAGR